MKIKAQIGIYNNLRLIIFLKLQGYQINMTMLSAFNKYVSILKTPI